MFVLITPYQPPLLVDSRPYWYNTQAQSDKNRPVKTDMWCLVAQWIYNSLSDMNGNEGEVTPVQ